MTRALGLDFGTTNTVLAMKAESGAVSVGFESAAGHSGTMRTCLSFMKGRDRLAVEAGAAAIATFIENPGEARFLQSIKTFAASTLFQGTLVFGRKHEFQDLMVAFLKRLEDYAGFKFSEVFSSVAVGRPVRFAGMNPDEQLAIERYNDALQKAGLPTVHFVYEPVAAAVFFAERLRQDAIILVADFGGGTTDYSIIRFEASGGNLRAQPLAHSGVGVAGDQFDFRMIDNIVSPLIGKGTYFKSFDKLLEIPSNYYVNFGRWNQLSIFKTLKDFQDLKSLVRAALEPEKLEAFIDLVEHDEGYPLYQAISATKMKLFSADETEFYFAPLGEKSRRIIRRAEFDGWIADDLRQMETALDAALQKSRLDASQIDKVFLTGGTSFVPAVRSIFERRFGETRIESGSELLSIAHGLALIGERSDIDHWVAKN